MRLINEYREMGIRIKRIKDQGIKWSKHFKR